MAIKSEVAVILKSLFSSDEFKIFLRLWASYKDDYNKQLLNLPIEDQSYDKRMAQLQGIIMGMDTIDKVQLNVEQEIRRINEKKLTSNE